MNRLLKETKAVRYILFARNRVINLAKDYARFKISKESI